MSTKEYELFAHHSFTKNMLLLTALLFCNSLAVFAQSHISTQAHDDTVTNVLSLETPDVSSDVFFSAGEDGFLIKWTSDNLGEHYQVSELQIKLVARNPNGNEIAVYETDGVSINRVSVWDWKNLTRKYAKRFSDSVTSISYSENGTYLIVGTAAINGVYLLNAETGAVAKKPSSAPSIVSLIRTGSTEKTAIFYAPSGSLVYYDIVNDKQKVKFNTEGNLEQAILFGTGDSENCYLAGIKNNTLYIIYALSGKTIAQYPARKALLCCSRSSQEQGLYYTSFDGIDYSLKLVSNDMLKSQIKATSDKVLNPPAPLIIKNFTGPKNNDSFTSVAKNMNTVMLGTKSGNIYTMNDVPEAEKLTLFPISEKMYERIYDLSSDGKDFYFLTKSSIYKSSYDTSVVDREGTNHGQTNCIKYNDGVILWSKDTKKSVQYLRLASGGTAEPEILFTPVNALQNVRLFGSKIVYIQGNSSVQIFDLTTKQNMEVYSGTALQDAVLYNGTDVYVAKTSAVEPTTPLVQVNISTKETVPLKITGAIAYSMSYDESKAGSPIYGITVTTQDSGSLTKVFSFSPSDKTLTNLLQLSDEDPNAFTALHYPILYTNIGKSNVRSYNLESRSSFQYKRSASMPVKMESANDKIAVLNRDGSISWYNSDSPAVLADWYLTVDGQWFEF